MNIHWFSFCLTRPSTFMTSILVTIAGGWIQHPELLGHSLSRSLKYMKACLSIEKFPANFHMEITPKEKAFVTDDNPFQLKIVLLKVKTAIT